MACVCHSLAVCQLSSLAAVINLFNKDVILLRSLSTLRCIGWKPCLIVYKTIWLLDLGKACVFHFLWHHPVQWISQTTWWQVYTKYIHSDNYYKYPSPRVDAGNVPQCVQFLQSNVWVKYINLYTQNNTLKYTKKTNRLRMRTHTVPSSKLGINNTMRKLYSIQLVAGTN